MMINEEQYNGRRLENAPWRDGLNRPDQTRPDRPSLKPRLAIVTVFEASTGTNVLQASKVAVLGAAGGIGQPLSLLLKLNPRVSELALYDIKGAPGV